MIYLIYVHSQSLHIPVVSFDIPMDSVTYVHTYMWIVLNMYTCIIIIHTYVAMYVYAWTKCCFWDFWHNSLASSKIFIYNKLLPTHSMWLLKKSITLFASQFYYWRFYSKSLTKSWILTTHIILSIPTKVFW